MATEGAVHAPAAPAAPPPDAEERPSLLEQLIPPGVRRLFATMLVLSAASFVADRSTYASFTAVVSSPNNVFTTGSLELSTTAPATSLFSISAMLPGDEVYATVVLRNSGTLTPSSYTMSTSVASANVLSTDTVNGLQLTVDRCSVAWSGTVPYTCAGTLTSGVVSGPLVQTNVSMARTLVSGAEDDLRVRVSLPTSAGNSFQDRTVSVTFEWDVSQ